MANAEFKINILRTYGKMIGQLKKEIQEDLSAMDGSIKDYGRTLRIQQKAESLHIIETKKDKLLEKYEAYKFIRQHGYSVEDIKNSTKNLMDLASSLYIDDMEVEHYRALERRGIYI